LRLQRITVDVSALRASRELRWLVLGNFVSGLGTQAALVALPYQVYVETRSALLTGLLGAVELGPLVAMALLGGALADRMDRRRLLMIDQIGLVAVPAALCAAALAGSPPLLLLYGLGGLLAGFGALQNVARSAIVPNLVEAGVVASLAGTRFSVVSGGLACVAGALVVAAASPALVRYDKEHALAELVAA
jgi:MFS family permease